MHISILVIIILLGFLTSYMAAIGYVKGIRENLKKHLRDIDVILISIVFGGPALLITYMFSEVRIEDTTHHYRYLICGIVFTILQILIVVLLFVFNVIKFE